MEEVLMAKPRIFISSTYYDLRSVRADLERFIKEQGYEPVLFEHGHVPYGAEEQLEEDCYREISACDVLVNIIGGSFGTESKDTRYSISQNELRTAQKLRKQIYIFVEKAVLAEYKTYLANKEVEGFTPISVNDTRVFEFLEEVYVVSGRNPVVPFEISQDIILFLREQWAGLFQILLQEHARQKEINLLEKIESTADTLNQMVNYLTEERTQGDQAIRDILLSNHPLFASLKTILSIPYRVFFENINEMEALLTARNTVLVQEDHWDDEEFREYISSWVKVKKLLKISSKLFDENGKLKVIKPDEWDDDYICLEEFPETKDEDKPKHPVIRRKAQLPPIKK